MCPFGAVQRSEYLILQFVCLEMEENKASIANRLQAVKHKSGKSYSELAAETGLTNVYVAQLLKRQAQLKPDTAPKLRAALPDLPEDLIQEMMKPPMRSYDPNLIQEPTVYRFLFYFLIFLIFFLVNISVWFLYCRLNEAIMHFGESIKEIINEEFGDGM